MEPDEEARFGNSQPRVDGAGEGKYLLATDPIENLPENILEGRPYPVEALFLFHTDPLFSHPKRGVFIKAFEKIPFIVSFSPFLDETSLYADLILPDQAFLERWQGSRVRHISGFSLFSLGKPVVEPPYGTRDSTDFLMEVAKRLGGGMARAFPWKNWEDLLIHTAEGLYHSREGYVVSIPKEEAFRQFLEKSGYRIQKIKSFETFWQSLSAKGAWWNPGGSSTDIRKLLRTPSGKFEFYSNILKNQIKRAADRAGGMSRFLDTLGLKSEDDRLYLPHHDAVGGEQPSDSSFVLNTYRLMSMSGVTASSPWLQETLAPHVEESWGNWVEINSKRARELGIRNGDRVWIDSPKGKIQLPARILPTVAPDMVHIPFGQGHRAYGRWARGRGSNPNDVILSLEDTLKGFGILAGTRVKITKA